jgi:hypothetical protein
MFFRPASHAAAVAAGASGDSKSKDLITGTMKKSQLEVAQPCPCPTALASCRMLQDSARDAGERRSAARPPCATSVAAACAQHGVAYSISSCVAGSMMAPVVAFW